MTSRTTGGSSSSASATDRATPWSGTRSRAGRTGRHASKAKLPILELDPTTGKTRRLDKPPPRRLESGAPVLARSVNQLSAYASPDKKYVLADRAVIDVATERDVVRWGPPDTPEGVAPLAAFLHEGGIEVASGLANTVPMRLGPARKTRFIPPPLRQGEGCPEGNYEPQRVVDGAETLYLHYESGCVCSATGCRTTRLPDGMVLARGGTRTLSARAARLEILDDAGARSLPNEGDVAALTFAGDEAAGVVTATKAERAGFWRREFMLREIDSSTGTTRWSRPFVQDVMNSFQLLATPRSFVTVSALNRELQAFVWPRGASGAAPTRIDAWVGQAIIQFPDGKVEILGDAVESALACRDGDTVRPFATCRSEFEVKGTFAIE